MTTQTTKSGPGGHPPPPPPCPKCGQTPCICIKPK